MLSNYKLIILIAFFHFVLASSSYAQTMFEDVAFTAGLQDEINELQFGIAWGDFDNDGYDDLFIAANPSNQLFKNNRDGTFTNIATKAGILDETLIAAGAAWGDYDGDGNLDLFVYNRESIPGESHHVENRLFRNNGDGTFTNMAREAGVSGQEEHPHEESEDEEVTGGFVGASWADYDNDGDLDLLVANRHQGPMLYQNKGDGTFQLANQEAGLILEAHLHEEETEDTHEEELHIGVDHGAWGDYDNDGDLDLFLSVAVVEKHEHENEKANSTFQHDEGHQEEFIETENRFFENNGDGTFTDRTDELGLGDPNNAITHCALWGDYNNDGYLDLFVPNRGSYNLETAAPSRLYRNNGDNTFTELAESSGIIGQLYPLGGTWMDIDNDGHLDLSLINHPSHEDFPAGQMYQKPHPLFRSNGDGTFNNINEESADALLDTGISDINHLYGLAYSDYDHDGDLDLAFSENHGDGPFLLYQNQTAAEENQWLHIELRDEGMNSFGIGSRIVMETPSGKQTRQVGVGNNSFASQSTRTACFGLGTETQAEVTVYWPGGQREDFGMLSAGKKHILTAGEGIMTTIRSWKKYE